MDTFSEDCCGPDTPEEVESEFDVDPNNFEVRASPTRITRVLKDGI